MSSEEAEKVQVLAIQGETERLRKTASVAWQLLPEEPAGRHAARIAGAVRVHGESVLLIKDKRGE